MKREDVKIGQKVVPFKKSAGGRCLEASTVYKQAKEMGQKFLYVNGFSTDCGGEVILLNYMQDKSGDFYLAEDFELYEKENKEEKEKERKGMKLKDVKIGQKVVPHAKTVGGYEGLHKSNNLNRAKEKGQPYLYVATFEGNRVVLSDRPDTKMGDYFYAEDFVLFKEKVEIKTERQDFELIFEGTTTIAYLKKSDGTYSRGEAKLYYKDAYDKEIGIRVAIAKALGEDFSHIYKDAQELESVKTLNKNLMDEVFKLKEQLAEKSLDKVDNDQLLEEVLKRIK